MVVGVLEAERHKHTRRRIRARESHTLGNGAYVQEESRHQAGAGPDVRDTWCEVRELTP